MPRNKIVNEREYEINSFLSLMFLLDLLAVKGYATDQPVKKEITVKGVVTDGVNFTQTDEKGR
ncbi:hypothetical protein [uncultured Bacteroides sp.]|uniref:hypothetical protein n=1 Tax=uncultured Bacteroides sp. TaxID=162156 RepID=UPI0025886D92|nr:hypothetical protein [uncultured Bacteroides sp.]